MQTLIIILSAWLLACSAPTTGGPRAPLESPAKARWSETEPSAWGTVAGTGAWVMRPLPALPGNAVNYAVRVNLTIDTASTQADPVHQIGAFSYYNNQADLGGYEAAIALRDNGSDLYRIQISAKWGEALLWSSRGGILQVRPFAFAVGQSYALRAVVRANHITLTVDGQPLLDVFDRTVPVATGGAALARKEGVVTLGAATVSNLLPGQDPDPGYAPDFSIRTWKSLPWGFDGDEPIFALGVPVDVAPAFLPTQFGCEAFEVKLVPGYTAQAYLPWYAQNGTGEIFAAGKLLNLDVVAQGATLHLQLQCQDPVYRPDLGMLTDVVLSYDPVSAAYVYDVNSTLTVPPGATLGVGFPVDLTDVGFFNGVPSSSTHGTQWPQPHPQSVFLDESGALRREPHNHQGWYPGYGTEAFYQSRSNYLQQSGGYWAMIGDPIANPSVELVSVPPGASIEAELCWWAYDLHVRWDPGAPTTVGPGSYTTHWRLVSLPAASGSALLSQASYATPGDLTQTYLVYTGGIGHTEAFDKVVVRASPYAEYPWGDGSLQDATGGIGGSPALRLLGANFASSATGSTRYAESFLAGTDYELSVWVKTQDVQGEGPGLLFGGQPYYLGLRGSNDWQRIGLVVPSAQLAPLDLVNFTLHNSGSGSVWFDDFQIRPVNGGYPAPYPESSTVPRPLLALSNPQPGVSLAWDARSQVADGTLLDQSGHANHGALIGASWVTDGGTSVIQLPGSGAYALLRGNPNTDLGAIATLTLWLKPAGSVDAEIPLINGGTFDNDLWTVMIAGGNGPNYTLYPQLPGVSGHSNPVIPPGQWTHLAIASDGHGVAAYVNGQLVVSATTSGRWLLPADSGYLRLGTGLFQGQAEGTSYVGELSRVRVYPGVLSAAQIQAEVTAGPAAL